MHRPKSSDRRARRAAPEAFDEASLRDAALRYLGRYDTSAARLREVLRRKSRQQDSGGHQDHRNLDAAIDSLVERLVREHLVDDRRYGEALVRRLRRRGTSTAMIRSRLYAGGITSDLAAELLRLPEAIDTSALDFAAACVFVRRRGFGPYRRSNTRPREQPDQLQQRELSALARAGFSFDVARRVLDAKDRDELERMARGVSDLLR